MMTCQTCQTQSKSGQKFCTVCGTAIPKSSPPISSKSAIQKTKLPSPALLKAISKSILKSLFLAIILVGPGLYLLVNGMVLPGMICMFLGSFCLMAWSYRKPWRLGIVSCLLPPLTAGLCYVFQLALFGQTAPSSFLLIAIGTGLFVGFLRAKTHKVTKDDKGSIIAQRTFGYLLIWVIAYGATQGFGYISRESLAVRAGLVTGAFSTAMLAMVSLVIWARFRKSRSAVLSIIIIGCVSPTIFISEPAHAANEWTPSTKMCFYVEHGSHLESVFFGTPAPLGANGKEIPYNCEIIATCAEFLSKVYYDGHEYVVDVRVEGRNGHGPTGEYYTAKRSGDGSCNAYIKNWNRKRRIGSDVPENRNVPQQPPSITSPSQPIVPSEVTPPNTVIGPPTPEYQKEEIVTVTVAVTAALVAAGIAINIAQAIAAALAQAMQAGVHLTTDEINEAVLNALAEEDDGDTPPPEGVAKFPPIYFAEGDPFEVNEQGQYFAPDKNGVWAWRSAAEAREFEERWRVDQARVYAVRESEITAHDREAKKIAKRSGEQNRLRDDETRAKEQRAKAETQARRDRINADAQKHDPRSAPGYNPTFTTTAGNAGRFLGDWLQGIADDNLDLITKTPEAIAVALADVASETGKVLLNPDNWKTAGQFGVDFIGSQFGHQESQARINARAKMAAKLAAKLAAHGIKATLDDPLGSAGTVIGGVLGLENWEKTVDPKIPVTERVGRAIWGAVDLGGVLYGAATGAGETAEKIGDALRVMDRSADTARGLKAADRASDALRVADDATDVLRGSEAYKDARGRGLSHAGARRHAEAASDATQTAEQAARAKKTRAAGSAASSGNAKPGSLDELRETLRNQKRGAVANPGTGSNVERYGIPDVTLDPEGHVRSLPKGALLDRNTASAATGWSGDAIDDLARFSKQENVIVGARTTNVDSMKFIRDGTAIPKPVDIKAKTIGKLDVYLGAEPKDKGLVGFFKPQDPPKDISAYMPNGMKPGMDGYDDALKSAEKLKADVAERFNKRREEFFDKDIRKQIAKMTEDGKLIEKDGKLFSIVKDANGKSSDMPFAGDIDGVYFKNATPPHEPITGEDYKRLKQAWMGGSSPEEAARLAAQGRHDGIVPNYFGKSQSAGQHGVETNIIPDFVEGQTPNTPGFDKARGKAIGIHTKLEEGHPDEIVIEVYGHTLKRGETFDTKINRLPRYEDRVLES